MQSCFVAPVGSSESGEKAGSAPSPSASLDQPFHSSQQIIYTPSSALRLEITTNALQECRIQIHHAGPALGLHSLSSHPPPTAMAKRSKAAEAPSREPVPPPGFVVAGMLQSAGKIGDLPPVHEIPIQTLIAEVLPYTQTKSHKGSFALELSTDEEVYRLYAEGVKQGHFFDSCLGVPLVRRALRTAYPHLCISYLYGWKDNLPGTLALLIDSSTFYKPDTNPPTILATTSDLVSHFTTTERKRGLVVNDYAYMGVSPELASILEAFEDQTKVNSALLDRLYAMFPELNEGKAPLKIAPKEARQQDRISSAHARGKALTVFGSVETGFEKPDAVTVACAPVLRRHADSLVLLGHWFLPDWSFSLLSLKFNHPEVYKELIAHLQTEFSLPSTT